MCEKSPLGEEGRFYCPNYLCVLACNWLGFRRKFSLGNKEQLLEMYF